MISFESAQELQLRGSYLTTKNIMFQRNREKGRERETASTRRRENKHSYTHAKRKGRSLTFFFCTLTKISNQQKTAALQTDQN